MLNYGRFGCSECYNTFSNKIESVLKNLHGTSKHRGRAPKNYLTEKTQKEDKMQKTEQDTESNNIKESKVNEKQEKIDKLNKDLQQAIKEERYEDAAKYRDEIKKIQSDK